ncbi:hypothetical protein [Ekhidna sp.]|uniref:hypothetical protein n=1 Tax=Ekhidna sp. TaxID=2608089 RepID=UPI003C7E893C
MVNFVMDDFFDRKPLVMNQFSFLSGLHVPPPTGVIQEVKKQVLNNHGLDYSRKTGFNLIGLISYFRQWIRKVLIESTLWSTVRLAPDAKQE